jgi:hypothetical protein
MMKMIIIMIMMKLPVFGENTLTLSSHLPGDVRHVDLPVEFHNCNKRDKMNTLDLDNSL